MNWYKKALNRLNMPNLKNVAKERIKLFNYLKSLNIKHTFFHGTSEKVYEEIKKNGYIMSPASLTTESMEDRSWGQDRVFYTSSVEYASIYADRAADFTNSTSIVLQVEIPVHLIAEIREAILNPKSDIINETTIFDEFKEIINQDLSKTGIEKIIERKIFSPDNSNEFSTYIALPSKYISGAVSKKYKQNKYSYDFWKNVLKDHAQNWLILPEKFKTEEMFEITHESYKNIILNKLIL